MERNHMNGTPITPNYLRYGGAKKSTFEMTGEELAQAAKNILRRAREKAFSKGLPIYFTRDGILMAEYPDGHVETVTKG
jgi:hypothetical protein